MKKPSFFLLVALPVCLLLAADAFGQQSLIFTNVQINSSPNPVGSGARAQGMGGAFIAIADDATAASWNPGGLMQLERPEVSFVFNYDHRGKDLESSAFPEADGDHDIDRGSLNYFSVAFPFRAFDKNMVVSLNYQRLYDFYDDFDFDQNIRGTSSSGVFTDLRLHTDFRQSGSLKAIAPAYAIQITPRFSMGMTLNFWTDELGYDNDWESVRVTTGSLSAHAPNGSLTKVNARQVYRERNDNVEGFNMNFGFLWHATKIITIGGVVKTPFTLDFDRKTYILSQNSPAGPLPPVLGFGKSKATVTHENGRLHFPLSYGLGIAFRWSDAFTTAVDVYRTHWSDFWASTGGRKTSPITGDRRSRSHVHDTTQVRIGGEYLFVLEKTLIPLRLGLFYDPEPSRKNPDDYFGVSVGTGVLIGNIQLDCAYIYRWGRDVKGDVLEVPGTTADINQHSVYLSMIYLF